MYTGYVIMCSFR